MGLTRKHFAGAAEEIRKVQDGETRREMAKAAATFFRKTNPRFNQPKFLAACDVTPESEQQRE